MRFESNKKILCFVLLAFFSVVKCFSFEYEDPNKIDVTISPEITYDSQIGTFKYNYSVSSSIKSIQEVRSFWISTSEAYQNVVAPLGWDYRKTQKKKNKVFREAVYWSAGWGNLPEGNITPNHANIEGSPYQIKPGQSTSGFSLESKSLPGIVSFFALGFTKMEPLNDGFTPVVRGPIWDRGFKGLTIGPIATTGTSLGGLLDRLIMLKDSMPSYGWITNQGIINSLNVKLNAAKESIAKGNNKTAQNHLNAFINELDAQKGKQVNESAWALLKANAEYLISKLGP